MIIAGLLGLTMATTEPMVAFTAKNPYRGSAKVYLCNTAGKEIRTIEGNFVGDCESVQWVGSERLVWFAESRDRKLAEVWTATLSSLKPVRVALGTNLNFPSQAVPGPFNFSIQEGGPMAPIRFVSINGNGKLVEPVKWRSTWVDLAASQRNEVIEAKTADGLKRTLRYTPSHENPISLDNPMGKPTALVFSEPVSACVWERARNEVTVTTTTGNLRYGVYSIDWKHGVPVALVANATALDYMPGSRLVWAQGGTIHLGGNKTIQPTQNIITSVGLQR